jgi:hypothetical protein
MKGEPLRKRVDKDKNVHGEIAYTHFGRDARWLESSDDGGQPEPMDIDEKWEAIAAIAIA